LARREPNGTFKFQKRRQLLIRRHNETLSVAAMHIGNDIE